MGSEEEEDPVVVADRADSVEEASEAAVDDLEDRPPVALAEDGAAWEDPPHKEEEGGPMAVQDHTALDDDSHLTMTPETGKTEEDEVFAYCSFASSIDRYCTVALVCLLLPTGPFSRQ